MAAKKTRRLTVMLTDYEYALLRALAEQDDRSLSYVAGRAICHEATDVDHGLARATLDAIHEEFPVVVTSRLALAERE